MIEVEIRSFLTKEQYDLLEEFFIKNAKFIKEDNQETHYFKADIDLRIQKNDFFSKIWMKSGKIHEESREELEIKLPQEQFENLKKLFSNLGYETEIKWFRKRREFDWNGITVCLDYTKGYGYILEMEKLVPENQEEALAELKAKFNELNIEITPKQIFDDKYNYYKQNWKSLVN